MDIIKNNIRYFRLKKGLTQKKLAIKTNISRGYLISLEKGSKQPTISVAFEIAKILEQDIETIFFEPNVNYN